MTFMYFSWTHHQSGVGALHLGVVLKRGRHPVHHIQLHLVHILQHTGNNSDLWTLTMTAASTLCRNTLGT